MAVGFSTGCFHRERIPLSQLLKQLENEMAVEISALREEELKEVIDLRREDVERFEFVSIHAPSTFEGKVEDLEALEEVWRKLLPDVVVIHPSERVDLGNLASYGMRYAFENMDFRKDRYRTAEEMKPLFDEVDARFCLDISHCFGIDRSGKLVEELLEAFGGRLSHIHLSGHCQERRNGHCTLRESRLRLPKLPETNVIIESPLQLAEREEEKAAALKLLKE